MELGHEKQVVRIFSAKACAAPLYEAASAFERETGIEIEISVCSRHCAKPEAEEAAGMAGSDDFLLEIAEDAVHDLAIAGAEYLLDEGEVRGIVRKNRRRTIANRVSAILVPSDNPKCVATLDDLTREGVRIGISVIDCLKGLWEDIVCRLNMSEPIRRNIAFRANGCVAIMEAVAEHKVDAAFGWSAFRHLDPDRVSVISLPVEQQIQRGTCVGLLSFSNSPENAETFMDFLASEKARPFYRQYGWTWPESGE